MNKVFIPDSLIGCIVGGAIGDAMGGPYENRSAPVELREHARWIISDDTQLTLATCEAIAEQGHVSAEKIAAKFAEWFRGRRVTGMGASTFKALQELAVGAHWALAGRKGEMAAGNGAAMRVAPLAFVLNPDDPEDRNQIRDICRITHHSDEAYAGALAVVLAIRLAINSSMDEGTLLTAISDLLPDSNVRDRLWVFSELDSATPVAEVAREFGASGYVAESVPLAIYSAMQIQGSDFRSVLEEIIRAGGDTDTNAAMAGQIMGASLGYDRLPADLIRQLPELDDILQTAHTFAAALQNK